MKVEILHDPVADSKPRLQSQHSRGRLSSMGSFRTLLVILWLALAAYTAVVISRHGLGLLPIFFGDMAKLGWPGQFNLDFLSRSEEHTSELQSLMHISYAVFCLKKKNI